MDNGDNDSPTSQKELSISLAASSMINASDMITQEAYRANLKRIQEVKEMVHKLEMNNEAAHKNYVVDQLEKRVKDGREAEDTLTRLRNQPGPPETNQFTNNVPSDRSEVILPTTATLVEVPESHSHPSHSPPVTAATSYPLQTTHNRPVKYQWGLPAQTNNPDLFRYSHLLPTVRQPPQHTVAPQSQGQMGWYTMQNVLPQPGVHNPPVHQASVQPTQVQQPSQSRGSYPRQVFALPLSNAVPAAPGYYSSLAEWNKAVPTHGPSIGSSSSTYREPGFMMQPTASRPLIATHSQPQNSPSPSSTFQVQVPFSGAPAGSAKTPLGQSPSQLHTKPGDSNSQSTSTLVSTPVAVSDLHHKVLPQLRQYQPQPQQPRLHPQYHPQSPQHPQHQFQRSQQPSQPSLHPQQHSQQSQARLPSQPPSQPPRALPQSTDRTNVSQPQKQPSQPTIVQEQARERGLQPRVDQATFIKLFQMAIQSGTSRFRPFWFHAKASGISDEWFNAAINSLPPGVWQSVIVQVNQSEPALDAIPENTSQPRVLTIPDSNVPPAVRASPLTTTSLVQTMPATQQEKKPAPSAVPVASVSPPANIARTQPTVATAKWDVPRVQGNAKTPRDANKSTLAIDILRSLGKMVPKPYQEMGRNPTEETDNDEGVQLSEVTPSRLVHVASPKAPGVLQTTELVDTYSLSMLPTKPNVQDEPQRVDSPGPLTVDSASKEAQGHAVTIEQRIVIDLTLEGSDESAVSKGQDPIFLIQTSAGAAASSQSRSPTSTTDHTPLLENLSLEEPPVNVAADCGNKDVHMYSPPLSPATEQNMDCRISHLPIDYVEPAWTSFEQSPHEASERPVDGQLPLFLPSPPVSPVHTGPPETDLKTNNDERESTPSLKRRSVDADVIEIDTGLVKPSHVRKRRRQQVYVLIPPAPPYVKKVIKKTKEDAVEDGMDSDLEGAGKDEELQYSPLERLLIEESKSRLSERRCRWLDCSAILNCTANLLAHLKIHAREEDSQAPFLCRWGSCQTRFGSEQEHDVHLERHATRPLPCPFSGCYEQFGKPVEVMKHEVQHQKADRTSREPLIRKPTYQPIVPAIPARMGPPQERLPSHRVIPRRVVRCRISADRHATVGPWVLWNIFSPVDLSMRKQNASMRCRPVGQPMNTDTDGLDRRHDDYDFLLALSSYPAKNGRLDDLDSTLVTMSAARGLTLWGPESAVNDGEGSATPEDVMPGWGSETAAVVAREESVLEERRTGQLMDEEEKMLIAETI